MSNRIIRFAAFSLASSIIPLGAAGFNPIPAAEWAMKEDPAHGVKGAVILEDKVGFTSYGIEHLLRVRILSEEGRSAAEILELWPSATRIQGRTSYRDGTCVLFDQQKDFFKKQYPRYGDRVHEVRAMVPPGVTADCIVEAKWLNQASMGDPPRRSKPEGFFGKLGGAFTTLKAELDFYPDFQMSYTVLGSPLTPVERQDSGSIKRYVFRNVPAAEFPPYSLLSLAPLPSFAVWRRPWVLSATRFVGVDGFWNEVGREIFMRWFQDQVKTGKTFKEFAARLLSDLPATPQAKAAMIRQRLDDRIRNTAYPTFEEKARQTHKDLSQKPDIHDLDSAVDRGSASEEGMAILFLALLREAGIHPTLALAQDRWFALFNYDLTDPFQAAYPLFGIPEPGRPVLWLDPSLRFAPPGMVQPGFQGTAALFLDTTTWKASRGQIPIQAGVQNVLAYAYDLKPGKEADQFTLEAGFHGWDAWLERRDLMPLEPREQARTVKEAFEKAIPQGAVSASEVKNAQNSTGPLTWSIEGTLEHPAAVSRSIDPFPGMASPLYLPQAWPERRNEPIVFDHLVSWTAKSRIHVPKGHQIARTDPVLFSNSFGRVVWRVSMTATAEESLAEVELRVDVVRPQAQPDAYGELKAFIDTVKKALHMQVFLEQS